jgi:cytochrome c oxidase assembly protein subunit 11
MLRLSANPAIDTVIKLVTVSVAMFAFVFVVMVPLYNVLCDALGINGKTAGQAYTAVQAGVDESREITCSSSPPTTPACPGSSARRRP